MNAVPSAATRQQTASKVRVSVDVELTDEQVEQVLDGLTESEVRELCEKHGIDLYEEPDAEELERIAEDLGFRVLPAHQACADDSITAERAYYAMHAGDMDTVRRFVCACAGRIA